VWASLAAALASRVRLICAVGQLVHRSLVVLHNVALLGENFLILFALIGEALAQVGDFDVLVTQRLA
jgi:hypothetical protein